MNYLAHIWLSGDDPYWQLGGFLGDFVKGPLPQQLCDHTGVAWPESVLSGVRLHRWLDATLDADPQYRHCLSRVEGKARRFAPVAMDVYLDLLLSRHWSRFHPEPQDCFNRRFYEWSCRQTARLPARAGHFLKRAQQLDLFTDYGREQTFLNVLGSIDDRFRVPSCVREAGEQLLLNRAELEPAGLQLLARFAQRAAETRQRLCADHHQQ